MRKNIKRWDRALRVFFGTLLLAYAIAGGPGWTFLSVYVLATGAWGFSPIYWFLRINATDT